MVNFMLYEFCHEKLQKKKANLILSVPCLKFLHEVPTAPEAYPERLPAISLVSLQATWPL